MKKQKSTEPIEEPAAEPTRTYESALRQVARLLKLAERAGSPAEAAMAAAKAQSLMAEFQIERTVALDAHDPKAAPDEKVEHLDDAAALDILGGQIPRWRISLASAIADSLSCAIYFSTVNSKYHTESGRYVPSEQSIALIGRKSDAEAVRYIYRYALAECERLVDARGKGMGKTWRNNFRLGVVDSISRQLRDQRRELHKNLRTKAHNDPVDAANALVVINNAINHREAVMHEINDYGKKVLHLGVRSRADGGAHDYSARLEGQKAGASIALGKAKRGLGTGK